MTMGVGTKGKIMPCHPDGAVIDPTEIMTLSFLRGDAFNKV